MSKLDSTEKKIAFDDHLSALSEKRATEEVRDWSKAHRARVAFLEAAKRPLYGEISYTINKIRQIIKQADTEIAAFLSSRNQIRSLVEARDELRSGNETPRLFKQGAQQLARYVELLIKDRKLDRGPLGVHSALATLRDDLELQLELVIQERFEQVHRDVKKFAESLSLQNTVDNLAALLDHDLEAGGQDDQSTRLVRAARTFEACIDDLKGFLREVPFDLSSSWERDLKAYLSEASEYFKRVRELFTDDRRDFTLRFKGRTIDDTRAAYESAPYPDPSEHRLPDLRTTLWGQALLVVGRHLDATQSGADVSESALESREYSECVTTGLNASSSALSEHPADTHSFQELAAQERDLLVSELLSQYSVSQILDETLALLMNADGTPSANAESLSQVINEIHSRVVAEERRIVDLYRLPESVAIKAAHTRMLTGKLPTWANLLERYPTVTGIFGRVVEKHPEILSQSEDFLAEYLGALALYRDNLSRISPILTEELDVLAVPAPTPQGVQDCLKDDLETAAKRRDAMKRREAEVLVVLTLRDLIAAGIPDGVDPAVVQLAAEVLVGGFYHLGYPVPQTPRGRASGEIEREVRRCLHLRRDISRVHEAVATVLAGPYVVCAYKDLKSPEKSSYHPRPDPEGHAYMILERITKYYARWSKRTPTEPSPIAVDMSLGGEESSQRRKELLLKRGDAEAKVVFQLDALRTFLINARDKLTGLLPELQSVAEDMANYLTCLKQTPVIVAIHQAEMGKPGNSVQAPPLQDEFQKVAAQAVFREQNERLFSVQVEAVRARKRGSASRVRALKSSAGVALNEKQIAAMVKSAALSYKPEFSGSLDKARSLIKICVDLWEHVGSERIKDEVSETKSLFDQVRALDIPSLPQEECEQLERVADLAKRLSPQDGAREPELLCVISACIGAINEWFERSPKPEGPVSDGDNGIENELGDQGAI